MIGATGAPTLDHEDHTGATIEEESTQELVQQLEAPTDDDEEDGDDCDRGSVDGDEAGLNPPAAWQALQYATYMTGTYQFVKEKHRAQGYLAAELARAEDEMAAEGRVGPVKRPTLEVNFNLR